MIFISREVGYYRWCKNTVKILNNHTDLTWETNDKLYPVCNEDSPSCWQNLVYSTLNNKKIKLLSKGICKEEYENRFKKN